MGHLEGVARIKYPCELIFCESCYGERVFIKADMNPSGPRAYNALTEWIMGQKICSGAVYKLNGYFMWYKNGGYKISGKIKAIL